MNFFAVFLIIGAVYCDDGAPRGPVAAPEDWTDYERKYSDSGRPHVYGSVRSSMPVNTLTTRRPPNYGIKIDEHPMLNYEDIDLYHHALDVHPPPIVPGQNYDPSLRSGKIRVPTGMVVPVPPSMGVSRGSDLYGSRPMGERHGDMQIDWRGSGGGMGGDRIPNHHHEQDIFNAEEQLIGDSGGGAHSCSSVTCEAWEYLCPVSCSCIHKEVRCDGNYDCEQRDDEINCEAVIEELLKEVRTNCLARSNHTMCPKTAKCIKNEWLCDGDDDCGDFTDETHCGARNHTCSEDQFSCDNGLCIQKKWVCDGDNDCKDYSDEMNCKAPECNPQEWRCGDGECVSLSFRCDSETDCSDGTDENNCETPMPFCAEGEFKCRGGSSMAAISATGGNSEIGGGGGGGGSGGSGLGRCILNRFRCDGDNDCGDWSDEENCPRKLSSCTTTEFKCDDGTCIPARWRCDRENDCDGGEDEKRCSDTEIEKAKTCGSEEFTCKDGRCILKTWLCDGTADCRRGEDEQDCEVHCEVGQFSCPAHRNASNVKICVNQKHICDGYDDCPGAEDELNCPRPRQCGSNSKCEQLCVVSAKGQDECACRLGYTLHANGYSCMDIDECSFNNDPVCSQKCVNKVGSFSCDCERGYILRPDLRSCKALGGAVQLIMANRADLRQVSLSSNKYTSILKGLQNAIALDFHFKKQLLFWSDVSTDVIKRAFVNGTGVRDVIKWGLESPGGVAVDWIHELLFWTDSGTRRVEVANFEGNLRAVVAANNLDKPRAIVVHPGEALVFWTDWGPNPKLERSYMDGSDRKVIIKEGVFWPNGLTIDFPGRRVFWVDAKHHVIESSAFDGSDRKKVLSNHLPHPFALTIFEDQIYWTDWNTKSISTANKNTGKGFRIIHEGLHFPMDIHSFHSARQPDYASRCAPDRAGRRGGCSHLCLPNKSARRCECPIGLTLKTDQRTCTTVPDKLLLVTRKKDIRIRQLDPFNKGFEVDMVIPLDGLKSAVALDWCSENDYIYWTDVGRGVISRAHLNGSNQQTIINANLVSPAGLALDWVTDKIYFTDPGTDRIEVATTDGKQRALMIWQDLNEPRDIVVNPLDSLMFWSDWGESPKIERAGMDGSERKAIAETDLRWPNGLAVELGSSRLYFVDGGTKALEYMNFDGSGRRKLISNELSHPFGLDIFDNKLFWTDWDTQSVEQADRATGLKRKTVIGNTTDLMDIRIFHRDRRFISNPCSTNNGGCSHICLLSPHEYKYTCACPIGVKLTDDNRTCKNGPSTYIIFAHRIDIRQVSLDIDYQIDVVLPIPPISNAVAVDVDKGTGDIFWSDSVEDVIMRSSVDGLDTEHIISESLDSVDGLVIDSIGRKIYWSDAGRHTIEVSELNGNHRRVVIWQELESPRGIAINYDSGFLFWSDWGTNPKIERAAMDGEGRKKIVTKNVIWPNSLTVDPKKQLLYWADAKTKTIEFCDFDGNYREKFLTDLEHPYGLAIARNKIYWTDWKTKSLNEADLMTKMQKAIIKDLEGMMDVKVVDENSPLGRNACGYDNGGCSHLCLRKHGGYSCKCPTGLQLKEGSQKECKTLPGDYLLIAMRSGIGRIALDTTDFFDVVLPIDGVHGAVVLDYHYENNLIIYADVNVDAIKTVNIENPSETRTIVSTGLHTPNGLAVDWIANNVYWTDTGLKMIEVARLDGSSRKTILDKNLNDPRAMILYPKYGYLFWSDWGAPPKIERCYMDGTGRKVVVDTDLGFPNGLAIDFDSQRLFWADALEDRIEGTDFEGKNRAKIVAHAPHPFGVTVFQSFVYWSDWYNKSVFRSPIPKDMENAVPQEVRRGMRGALEVRAVSKQRQPNHHVNPCQHENGGCTHLCLFRENSYICTCPDKPDGRECKYSETMVMTPLDNEMPVDTASKDDRDKNDSAAAPPVIIIASCILTFILILVIMAILVLVLKSRRKKEEDRTTSESSRSMLTFSNPNYNCADGQGGHGANPGEPSGSGSAKGWKKKFKYDKAAERVYEEKCIGENAATNLISAATVPTPQASPSGVPALPPKTIGKGSLAHSHGGPGHSHHSHNHCHNTGLPRRS